MCPSSYSCTRHDGKSTNTQHPATQFSRSLPHTYGTSRHPRHSHTFAVAAYRHLASWQHTDTAVCRRHITAGTHPRHLHQCDDLWLIVVPKLVLGGHVCGHMLICHLSITGGHPLLHSLCNSGNGSNSGKNICCRSNKASVRSPCTNTFTVLTTQLAVQILVLPCLHIP